MAALLSVWIALGALATAGVVVFTRLVGKESVVTLLPYTVAFSCTLAAGTLWAHRRRAASDSAVTGQRLQAICAILLNSLTFALLLFWLHGPLKGGLGLLLEAAFLCFVYWLYTRVLEPE